MAKKLPKKTVVIIGGGLTAGLISRQLTAKGVEVVVLERGDDHADGAEAHLPNQRDELRWSTRQGLIQNWAQQAYTLRHNINEDSAPIRWMEAFLPGSGIGGAGNHWNGHTWRWSEYDPVLRTHFEKRYGVSAVPKDMPIHDWGHTYAEMEPYHDLFEKLFGISGKAGNLNGTFQEGGNPFEAPRKSEYPLPPLEITEGGIIFKEATTKLGYKPFPMPAANASQPYTNSDGQKLGQCQYCGHCERFICEANAKSSPQVLLYPMLKQRKGFEIRPHSYVLGVNYDEKSKKATGVRYVNLLTGEVFEQPADVVVLAAFTMANTKILLVDKIGKPYDPKANTGVVGKNFCYQISSGVTVFFKNRIMNPFMASGSTATIIDEFNNDNFDHSGLGFLGGAYISAGIYNGRPIAARALPPGTPRWGSAWKKANADWYGRSFSVGIHGSCYPHIHNYLDLDPVYRDPFGQPLLRMTFDFRDNEVKMSQYLTEKAAGIAKATGADIIGTVAARKGPFDTRIYQTTHITGGTPMGSDPKTSVVSPRLQHWDAENLFVVGASVYPHNSGYNPTGPLAAMALRLGDDLADYVSRPRFLG